jgi:hypothetical protein
MTDISQYTGINKTVAEAQANEAEAIVMSQVIAVTDAVTTVTERMSIVYELVDDVISNSDIDNLDENILKAIDDFKLPTIPDIPKLSSLLPTIPPIQIELPTLADIYEYVHAKVKEKKRNIQTAVLAAQKTAAERERKTFVPAIKNNANLMINSAIDRVITNQMNGQESLNGQGII